MTDDTSQAWETQDAVALNIFLGKNPKVIAELERRMPEIKLGAVEEAAMTGAAHAGAESILKELKAMRQPGPREDVAGFIDPSKD